MKKIPILIMDFRYDEGTRPRQDNCCPCITHTQAGRGGGASGQPLIVEKWTKSELDKLQSKDISK